MKSKKVCLKVASILQIVVSGLLILDFIEELFAYLKYTRLISSLSIIGVLYIGVFAGLLLADGILMLRVSANDEWVRSRKKYNLVLGIIILSFIPLNGIASWFFVYAELIQSYMLFYVAIGVLRIVSSSLKEKENQNSQNVEFEEQKQQDNQFEEYDSKFEKIQKLADLRRLGLISEQEFNQLKSDILNNK